MQKNIILTLVMLILGLIVIFLFLPRIMSPKIQIETTEYNFGDIRQQKTKHILRVKNIGRQVLEIKRVSTSCGCTTASIDKKSLASGESASLTIAFDPNLMGEIGPVEKVVYIRSNDPINEETAIIIKMNVMPEKSPSPSPVAFECPKEKYVNCMPIVSSERQKLCSGQYYEWIKNNCPNAEFTY